MIALLSTSGIIHLLSEKHGILENENLEFFNDF